MTKGKITKSNKCKYNSNILYEKIIYRFRIPIENIKVL